jgi:4-hydroxy-tetrahydrodipicolinate synthase
MILEGVYVAVVTPFQKDGSLDTSAFRSHVQWLVDSGVQGLVPCGTTGESPTLSHDERTTLIQICLEIAAPKGVGVVAGCGSNSTASTSAAIAQAESLGCHGTLIVTPYYNKPTPAGVIAHYTHLADRATKPIILYHVPGRTSVPIPLESVAQLFQHPRIGGMKEASGNYGYWLGLAQIAKDTGKTIFAGDDDAFAVIQAYGGRGLISASANAVPAAFVKMDSLMRAGKWAEAFDLQLALAPLIKAFFAETNPAPVKFALHHFRQMSGELRLPLVPVGSATEQLIVREWEKFEGRFV